MSCIFSFNFINISYLLYFFESALLSLFICLSEYEYLCADVTPLIQVKLSLLFVGILPYGFSCPDKRAQVRSLG